MNLTGPPSDQSLRVPAMPVRSSHGNLSRCKIVDRRGASDYISQSGIRSESIGVMTDQPILAAGGIVVRGNTKPTVAIVQLRKGGDWVLPKGKLNNGEDAITAAQREVHEETGQSITVQEFVGTLCYEVNGRSKIVQFWRMHPNGGPARELMNDIRQVAWLPLEKAIRKLARPHERAFLQGVGPAAIRSHRQSSAIRAVPTEPVAAPAPATAPIARRRNVVTRALNWLRHRRA